MCKADSHPVIHAFGHLASGSEFLKGTEPSKKLVVFVKRWFLGLLAKCHRGDGTYTVGWEDREESSDVHMTDSKATVSHSVLNFRLFKGNVCPLCKSQSKEVIQTQTTLRQQWCFLGKHLHSWNIMSMQTCISFSRSALLCFRPHYVISSII